MFFLGIKNRVTAISWSGAMVIRLLPHYLLLATSYCCDIESALDHAGAKGSPKKVLIHELLRVVLFSRRSTRNVISLLRQAGTHGVGTALTQVPRALLSGHGRR